MAINIKNQIFTLHTKNSTYQMKVDEQNMLIHTYYGNRTDDTDCSYLIRMADRGFSGNIPGTDRERVYSLDFLPQEFPVYGDGDYRVDCLKADLGSGVQDGMFFFDSYQVREGKYNIPGLPAFFSSEKSEGETLEIVLKDTVEEVYVHLLYGVFEELDIITRAAVVENRTEGDIQISRIMSACLDLGMGKYDLIHFYGKHAGERQMERNSLPHGITELRSTRGTSSHQHNPFVILADKDTTESTGECYSASFLYSGGFHAQAEVDQFNQTRLVIGIDDYDFSWKLKKGESFSTPEVCLTYSADGFSKLSQTLHQAIVSNLIRSCWKDRVRPILVNNWEATYFDFNKDNLIAIAKEAAELNLDMLVLDDGWFGKRDDDFSGLGDWFVNEKKLCGTLSELVKEVHDMGLSFFHRGPSSNLKYRGLPPHVPVGGDKQFCVFIYCVFVCHAGDVVANGPLHALKGELGLEGIRHGLGMADVVRIQLLYNDLGFGLLSFCHGIPIDPLEHKGPQFSHGPCHLRVHRQLAGADCVGNGVGDQGVDPILVGFA